MQYGETERKGDDCCGKHTLLITASEGVGMPSPTRPQRVAPETVRKQRQGENRGKSLFCGFCGKEQSWQGT